MSRLHLWVYLWVLLRVGLCGGLAEARKGTEKADSGSFAIYCGPWGGAATPQGLFLLGDEWRPAAFVSPPEGLEPGAQGRLTWRNVEGGERKVIDFDPAEVPLRLDELLPEGSADPPAFAKRSAKGAVMLLLSLGGATPQMPQIAGLFSRWHKAGRLTGTDWVYTQLLLDQVQSKKGQKAGKSRKSLSLAALAKKDPAAAYLYLGQLFRDKRYAEARAVLKKGKALDPLLSRSHDEGEPNYAPVVKARPPSAASKSIPPTGLSFSVLLVAASAHGQGKEKECKTTLAEIARKWPRFRESLIPSGPAADEPGQVDLSGPFPTDRPRALAALVPGFLEHLTK